MSVINKLSTTLGRRDQVPNQLLAKEIVRKNDKKSIKELIDNLNDKKIQSDCIKVLYEAGELKPELIAEYDKIFLEILSGKNNRLIWGAMTALDCIASLNPKGIYKNLAIILDTADKGTVITKDHAINILIKLSKEKKYSDNCITLLLDQLKISATNQLAMYAENALPVISEKYKKEFIKVLTKRIPDIERETLRMRVEKVIRKLENGVKDKSQKLKVKS